MNDCPEPGQILRGPLFNEPVRVETVQPQGEGRWALGVVGVRSEKFRKVTLESVELAQLTALDTTPTFDGDGHLLRLGLQAYVLGIAYEFDPYFGLSMSRVDPLPHQLEAVYDHLLKPPRVRFLLADDAGAGKTIMAGLLLRELKLRGLVERTLILCPANLTFQWQRELNERFDEKFEVIKGGEIRDQFGVNQWLERRQVISSLDLAKRSQILPGLKQARWDLVIVDEAHRMSWTPPARKTARYALGELLRDSADHLLLLTATPHKGNAENFSLFLQLLDQDAFADVRSIRRAMERRQAPFYLRRTKEAMVHFPERQPDGTWAARKIFTRRIPHTADFQIDGAELDLYAEVTRFVKRQSARAAEQGEEPRARAVGFLMALYQRRLASSTHALRRSLENRARRLDEALKRAENLALQAPPSLPDPDELEEMEEVERQRLEEMLEAVTLAASAAEVREEIEELRGHALRAKAVEEAGAEAKLSKLEQLLHSEGFFAQPDQRLLIFTEFRDTLDYLVELLRRRGFRVGFIHGGMKPGSRDEPGTRIYAEQQFKEGATQILVATEAAGEGINLQVCHVLFNYDIPWNPNRLEQRMGRIHRYGQTQDCLIFNFVATNTIEGKVLHRLLERLQEIRDALEDDAVFNVVGEILPAAHVERVLRDYYAGRFGDHDLEDRLLRNVDERQFRAICQNALEGLASKRLNLDLLVERRARAQEQRVVPEAIARFLQEAAAYVPLQLRPAPGLPHSFLEVRTPTVLHRYEAQPDWRLPRVAARYPRFSTDRETAESAKLEWVTPGHPLFEAVRRHVLARAGDAFGKGACFYSLGHETGSRVDVYRARVVDGLGDVVQERLFLVEMTAGGERFLREPSFLGNLNAADAAPEDLPAVASEAEAPSWLHHHALAPFLEETRAARLPELDRIAEHIELSLTALLESTDGEIGRAVEEQQEKVSGAEGRLAQAEARHAELTARRERRRDELLRQRSLSLQAVERLTTALVLPHPQRQAPDIQRLRSDPETERIAMEVVLAHERSTGRQVYDVHERNLGYDITSLDLATGQLRLIEVKGIGAATGTVLLTPNEHRVAEDRPDCYWLYMVTHCKTEPRLQEPIPDPGRFPWHEVTKVEHFYLSVDALRQPMEVWEEPAPYGGDEP